jgi:hypothetical protein
MKIRENPEQPKRFINSLKNGTLFMFKGNYYLKINEVTRSNDVTNNCVALKEGRTTYFDIEDMADRVLIFGDSITLEV